MAGFLERCHSVFGTRNLYEIFEVPKTASEQQIKKSYYKISLKTHPDRADETDKKKSTELFQLVGNAYSILSDKEKRAVYDDTGEVPDGSVELDRDWNAYWRLIFKKISIDDIEKFQDQYRGSQDELEDLKVAYEEGQGDMDHILETVLCAEIGDEPRFREILQNCIDNEELEAYEAFTNEKKAKTNRRRKRYAKEAKEAEEMVKKGGGESLESAIAMKQKSRQQECDSFFSHLEAKYCQPQQKSKKPKKADETSNGKAKRAPKRKAK